MQNCSMCLDIFFCGIDLAVVRSSRNGFGKAFCSAVCVFKNWYGIRCSNGTRCRFGALPSRSRGVNRGTEKSTEGLCMERRGTVGEESQGKFASKKSKPAQPLLFGGSAAQNFTESLSERNYVDFQHPRSCFFVFSCIHRFLCLPVSSSFSKSDANCQVFHWISNVNFYVHLHF